jgi:hypothetical protein
MAKNSISDLRDHLFETLERLKDKDEPMELDRAKAICQVSQVIINSAKVEVDYLETVGEVMGQTIPDLGEREFFNRKPGLLALNPGNGKTTLNQ